MCKNLKHLIKIIFFVIIYQNLAYSIDINDGGTTTAKQTFTSADTTLTISNSSTLSNALNNMININGQDNGTVIIEAGSTAETTVDKSNTINGASASGLTITNSGTIISARSKAINLTDAEDGSLTNNSGGIIQANTNTISLLNNSGTTNNMTINNYGTIFATDDDNDGTNTIKSDDNSTNVTINNFKGGHIYHTSESAVVVAGGSATLTNSGKIENKDGPAQNAITLSGSAGATLNLKDSGIVIGKINITDSGHTIKVNHGMGQSYYYDTPLHR